VFRKRARYRIEGTLTLRNRRGLTINGNGATFFATTRGRREGRRERSQFLVLRGKRIVFRNLHIRGANKNAGTADEAYIERLEAQHGISFEGVVGAEVDHVQVNNVYGDFVYIGRTKRRRPSSDVWIHDSRFSGNGRTGIGVVGASNVIIERNHIDQTRRSTFDLEPGTRSARVTNVFILNNTVGEGRLLFVASHGGGAVSDVVISGNRLVGHAMSIDAGSGEPSPRRSNWVVVNNTSDTPVHRQPMTFFRIDGVAVHGNRQEVEGDTPAVVLIDVCGAEVSGNQFTSTRIRHTTPVCDAPLVVPKPPAIMGRGNTGAVLPS
jgi:hypothetical protein